MQAYAYRAVQLERTVIVKILREDGYLLNAFETNFVSKKLKENLHKWAHGCNVQWVDKPWDHIGIKDAEELYKRMYQVSMDCQEIA